MIFPWPDFRVMREAVITWTLLIANIMMFLMISEIKEPSLRGLKINQDSYTETSGRLFSQYWESLSTEEKSKRPDWIYRLDLSRQSHLEILGGYALRDRGFLDAAKDFVFSGDQVAISRWKEELITYERRMSQLAVSDFGLRSNRSAPLQWITYQFTHVGVLHLLSNMFFLVVIGASIEAMLGGFSLLLIYLCGGVAGGIFFQFLHPESNLPMVGASAAVSAIMAFYVFYEKRKRVCYLYFVTPLQGQYGHIWLPVWLMVPMFLISDFTSYLTTAHGLQTGVAYSAHIGGIVFGSMLGLTMRFLPQPSRNTA